MLVPVKTCNSWTLRELEGFACSFNVDWTIAIPLIFQELHIVLLWDFEYFLLQDKPQVNEFKKKKSQQIFTIQILA